MTAIAPLFRWALAAIVACAIAIGLMLFWRTNSQPPPAPSVPEKKPLTAIPGQPWFVDKTAASGINFKHHDPATPNQYIHETLGSGLGWIDFNNDGWLDLFVVQAGPAEPGVPVDPGLTNKLYRNNGDGTFTDVTAETGLTHSGFGLGCAVGDYDNDGWDDLIVTYRGGMVLYHNESDGKGGRHFVDVTKQAKLDNNPHLATSCGLGRYRRRRLPRSLRLQLRRDRFQELSGLRHNQVGAAQDLRTNLFPQHHAQALSQQRQRHVHRYQRLVRHRRRTAGAWLGGAHERSGWRW